MDRSQPLTLNEETIPRGGLRVTRTYQVARACDGRFYLWMGRRRGPASGNRSSGRQVDVLKR